MRMGQLAVGEGVLCAIQVSSKHDKLKMKVPTDFLEKIFQNTSYFLLVSRHIVSLSESK